MGTQRVIPVQKKRGKLVKGLRSFLMMVGVLSYPIERQYFGAKVTIIRNIISFLNYHCCGCYDRAVFWRDYMN